MAVTIGTTNITYNDSTVQGSAWIGTNAQVFTANGTFTVPTGVTRLVVTVFGGGGGGGGGSLSPCAGVYGQPGGAGGAAEVYLTGMTPGENITVTLGAGGNGGNGTTSGNGGNGTAGGTTSFGAYVSCTGGAGGQGAPVNVALIYTINGSVTTSYQILRRTAAHTNTGAAMPSVIGTEIMGGAWGGFINLGGPGMSAGGQIGLGSIRPYVYGPGSLGGNNSGSGGVNGGAGGGNLGGAGGTGYYGGVNAAIYAGSGGGTGGVIVRW